MWFDFALFGYHVYVYFRIDAWEKIKLTHLENARINIGPIVMML
jgi:hypothetical protein